MKVSLLTLVTHSLEDGKHVSSIVGRDEQGKKHIASINWIPLNDTISGPRLEDVGTILDLTDNFRINVRTKFPLEIEEDQFGTDLKTGPGWYL